MHPTRSPIKPHKRPLFRSAYQAIRQPQIGYSATDNMNLGAFDGSLDYAGVSGRSDTNLPTQRLYPGIFEDSPFETGETDPALLAAFTGTGVYDLPISSLGTSFTEGGANFQSILTSNIGATIALSYVYTPTARPGLFRCRHVYHDRSWSDAGRDSV